MKLSGTRIIYHLHGKGISARARESAFDRLLYHIFFRGEDVIHNSPLLYYDIEEFVPRERVALVPNGLDVQDASVPNRSERAGPVKMLFLSNPIPSKGPLVLLDACALLLAKGLGFRAVYVGGYVRDLPQERFKKEIHDRGLEGKVECLGPRYGDEKFAILGEADVFILPTYYEQECFPMSILEAMAFGLPVVSTAEGAIPEILDDNETGFIVPRQDPVALAERLELLISDQALREKMGSNGRLKRESLYTVDIYREQVVAAIHSSLAS